jgi:hypothetical protein
VVNLGNNKKVDYKIYNFFDDENKAFELEEILISYYGRQDLKTGILSNNTSGDDGYTNPPIEYRKLNSEKQKEFYRKIQKQENK